MVDDLFLSVGAMKAGTTWLYENLKASPDIYFTPEKEIHYFSTMAGVGNELAQLNRLRTLQRVLRTHVDGNLKYLSEKAAEIGWYAEFAEPDEISNEWYEGLFRRRGGARYCADFSNLYCQLPDHGWQRVREVGKRLRVVYVLRDPLERLWSHYKFHLKWVGREEQVLDAGYAEFRDMIAKPWFIANSDYAGNLSRMKTSLREEELLVMYFEEFRTQPEANMQRILDFLAIPGGFPYPAVEAKVNATREYAMPSDWEEHAWSTLAPYVESMQELGIWHAGWRTPPAR